MVKINNLKLGLFNPGSLGSHHDEFIILMERHRADVVAINETWLRPGEDGRAPLVPDYRLRHIPRPTQIRSRGGGVGFYIKRGISARTLVYPIVPSVEQMWIRIKLNGKSLIVGTAYRPPWANITVFLDALSESISSLPYHDCLCLLGDFNVDYHGTHEYQKHMLDLFLSTHNLTQYVTNATHFTASSETLLDLICSNTLVSRIMIDHVAEISSHAFISCEINFKKNKIPLKKIIYRPLKDIDSDCLTYTLGAVGWQDINRIDDINDMVTQFTERLLWVFDEIAPNKTIRIKERHYPWITYNVKLLMRRRDEAHARARVSKLESRETFYKDMKQQVIQAIYREKSAYFNLHINSNIKNSSVLWNHLKKIINVKQKHNQSIPENLKDPNKINNYFLNVPGRDYASLTTINYYDTHKYGAAVFALTPTNELEISKILRSLKSNAIGIDGISLNMISLTLTSTLPIITKIINTSILTSTYPDLWQIALVRPLPKKDNVVQLKDLRPISILPCMSKLLERVVCNQLTQFLESNNVLPLLQSGFRKHHSTTTALLDVVDNVLCSNDLGEGTILVFLDFSRAFDTINRTLFLSKLKYYGFSHDTVQWFSSYLGNRKQMVEIVNDDGSRSLSECCSVNKGVPQGSILGPIIFALYCADIVNAIKYCKYHVYADDIQIYMSFKPTDGNLAIQKLNEDLNRISQWSESHSLVLNPGKTKYIILGTKKKVNQISNINPYIHIKGEKIERVTEARSLGLLVDEELRFEKHTVNTVRNCFYRLKVLYKIRDVLSKDMRIKLCDSLVLSKFNYADSVIGPRLLARTKSLIQRVQNACVRYCFRIPSRAHVSPYINDARMVKMEYRRQLHLATLLFGVIQNKAPIYLYNKLSWVRANNNYATRASSYRLSVPAHRTAAFRGSFRYAATKCWNNLPPPLRILKNVHTFRSKYKLYLFNLQLHS